MFFSDNKMTRWLVFDFRHVYRPLIPFVHKGIFYMFEENLIMANSEKWQRLAKTIGPGIMFAGTCIGGSHLLQSTKAGAFYGFGLLVIVLLANFFKYPFFEFASRYTNATGDSILEGYRRLGKSPLVIYGVVTFFSMFIITAAIFVFSAGLASNIALSFFDLELSPFVWRAIMFGVVLALLSYGQFKVLDLALKVIGIVLVLTVTIAFVSVVGKPMHQPSPGMFEIISTKAGFAFMVFLMGWMPMGVDMSAWHSIWTQERIKQTGYHPTLKETLVDFKIGYFITVALAIFFLTIGAKVIFGVVSPETIKGLSGLGYAQTLVSAFTEAIGSWSEIVISLAAFATMFGTALTLSDGYVRSMVRTLALLRTGKVEGDEKKSNYLIWLILMFAGSFGLINWITREGSGVTFGDVMNLATGTSFVIAPLAAYFNYKIIFNKEVPESHKPSKALKALAQAGIIFLSIFTLGYFYVMM